MDTHDINGNKIISLLVDKGYLEADGVGRGRKYYLAEIFKNKNNIKTAPCLIFPKISGAVFYIFKFY